MNGNDSFKRCKYCGKMIGVIRGRMGRKIIVDADTKFVHEDQLGEIYIRLDGTKMRGKEDMDWNDDRVTSEAVWQQHKCKISEDEV